MEGMREGGFETKVRGKLMTDENRGTEIKSKEKSVNGNDRELETKRSVCNSSLLKLILTVIHGA